MTIYGILYLTYRKSPLYPQKECSSQTIHQTRLTHITKKKILDLKPQIQNNNFQTPISFFPSMDSTKQLFLKVFLSLTCSAHF